MIVGEPPVVLESWISIFFLSQNMEYYWAFPVQGRFLAETSRVCRNPEGTWDVIAKGK